MRETREAARMRLEDHRQKNARKQKKHRDSHLEESRIAEKTKTRARRARLKEARHNRRFIAIDAEGVNIGEPFLVDAAAEDQSLDLGLPERAADDRRLSAQDHRTFLWGAGGDDSEAVWLGGQNKKPLSSREICEWLVSLPARFPGAIFVMFSAGYDWTQIFRDMTYEKAWELWTGLPWSEHDSPTGAKSNRRRLVLWGNYGLRLYPGKYLEVAKFKNPERIKNAKGNYDFASKIKVYDTFGFFQSSFIRAATGFGGNFLKDNELEIILGGKSRRGEFSDISIDEIRKYTAVELRVLARMMTNMREGLKRLELKITDWHGAGCISQAMMKKDQVTNYYPDISAEVDVDDLSDPLAWALRAYFGGRAELIKQGVHHPQFLNYDISSAHPHILRQLPNMKHGKWVDRSAKYLLSKDANRLPLSRFKRSHVDLQSPLERLKHMSLVSMVRVRFHFPPCHRRVPLTGQSLIVRRDLPWFPLPIRADDGTIYFPRNGEGIYAAEEVRAMLRWAMRAYESAEENEYPIIALLGAFEFIPINDAKPFRTRVESGFAERAAIIERTEADKREWEKNGKKGPEPYDAGEKVWKLGLNALYGKLAQSKGLRIVRDAGGVMRAKPPKQSNLYFAAVVTGGTRAMLLDASAGDIDAVILFATDGICSIRELPGVEIPQTKTLGAWEKSYREHGVFVKSGIYSHRPAPNRGSNSAGAEAFEGKPGKPITKMRGTRPSSLPPGVTAEQWLIKQVPEAWKRAPGSPARSTRRGFPGGPRSAWGRIWMLSSVIE